MAPGNPSPSSTTAAVTEDSACPFGPDLAWQWEIRRELFSRADEGVRFDAVGLIAVKPEAAAMRLARALPGRTALDAFSGIGGTAIALARTGKRVLTADLDLERLLIARHNARVYGVADRMVFALADARALIETARVDAIYLDPPWGGMHKVERPRFGLRDYVVPADELLETALATGAAVALSVPPNFDFSELERFEPDVIEPVVHDDEILYHDVLFRLGAAARGA